MIEINRKVFVGVLLLFVVTISASVSYLVVRDVRVNYSSDINVGMSYGEFQKEIAKASEPVFFMEHGYLNYNAEAKFSREDIALMEKIVTAEAYGEPLKGKIAVANVVLNRVNSPWYPNSVEEVVYQRGQFNPTWDGSLEKVKDIDLSVKEAVEQALMGYQAVAEGTLFFLNEEIATDFTIPNTRKFEKKIGNHSFYR